MISKYRGVKYDIPQRGVPRWKVQLKRNGRVFSIFKSREELPCAWVADFCRYMTFGLDRRKWPGGSLKPNFAPCRYDGVHRPSLVRKLLMSGVVDPAVLSRRLIEYDDIANMLRPEASKAT